VLVASFLGGTVLRQQGLSVLSLIALVSLGAALVIAATLLGPWRVRFAVDARNLYEDLRRDITPDAVSDDTDAPVAAGFAYRQLQRDNAGRVRRMSALLGALAALMICQTLAWLTALLVS
jgi:hypothetical protein